MLFHTTHESAAIPEPAPDGSTVRPLLRLPGKASMATFHLPAGAISAAIRHRTVEELWYILAGTGSLWRRQGSTESAVLLAPGVCVTIPSGTAFQFRADTDLRIIAVTAPPWPGPTEAIPAPDHWPR
jgi:mannose-6-phosphate isomerase-like protein (cupin superfamily)